jgi:hypothetical protein
MLKILYSNKLRLSSQDLGLEVSAEAVKAPEELRRVLESMGVRTGEALAAVLQSFPTALASESRMDPGSFAVAKTAALEKLRPHVDPRLFQTLDPSQRRGFGAMPPPWVKTNDM